MTFIACSLNDLIGDIIADSVTEQIVVGPLGGPIKAFGREAMVYGFDYAIQSRNREGFFIGSVELEDDKSPNQEVIVHGIRNRFIRTLKRRNFHTIDTSTHMQFAHVCEGLWPGERTKDLRRDIESRKDPKDGK